MVPQAARKARMLGAGNGPGASPPPRAKARSLQRYLPPRKIPSSRREEKKMMRTNISVGFVSVQYSSNGLLKFANGWARSL